MYSPPGPGPAEELFLRPEIDSDADRPADGSTPEVYGQQYCRTVLAGVIPSPECHYVDQARRAYPHPMGPDMCLTLEKVLERVAGWSREQAIAIDGVSGMGKSTLTSLMQNRNVIKINSIAPNLTKGSHYNKDALRTIDYIITQMQIRFSAECRVVWDRSPVANMVYSMVHFLMDVWNDRGVPIPLDHRAVWMDMHYYFTATGLGFVIGWLIQHYTTPILILVSSDLRLAGEMMLNRGCRSGSNTDVYNAHFYNYLCAQYHAYSFFANLLGPTRAVLVDLSALLDPARNRTLDEVQAILAKAIDAEKKLPPLKPDDVIVPDRSSTDELYGTMADSAEMLLSFSKK